MGGAPKATPAAVLAAVETAVKDTLADADVARKLTETQEMTLVRGGQAELAAFFRKESRGLGQGRARQQHQRLTSRAVQTIRATDKHRCR